MGLSDTLQRVLAIYEFDYGALQFALENVVSQILIEGESTRTLSLEERLLALQHSTSNAQRQISQKTLINAPDNTKDLEELKSDLVEQNFRVDTESNPSRTIQRLLYKSLEEYGISLTFEQEMELQGKLEKHDNDERQLTLDSLARGNVEVALARWFALNLERAADAIKGFDDSDFRLLAPSSLQVPFRELHVNALLGNFGTAVVLCGAILERTLQDLLPSQSHGLGKLIEEAKAGRLLIDHQIICAQQIALVRDDLIHNRKLTKPLKAEKVSSRYGRYDFETISSDKAWELVGYARRLIIELYDGRMNEELGV